MVENFREKRTDAQRQTHEKIYDHEGKYAWIDGICWD